MSNRSRMLLAALVAANNGINFSVAEGELGRVRFDARALTFTGAETPIICEFAMATTLHGAMSKVAGTLVGSAFGLTISRCEGGGGIFRVLALPWHISYQSFVGTLPSITALGLRINGVSLLLEAFAGIVRCLYRGNIDGTTVGNPISEFRIGETVELLLNTRLAEAFCP